MIGAQIVVGDQHYAASLILTPTELRADWPPQTVAGLQTEHLKAIIDLQPDVVILGTGERQVFPSADLIGAFLEQGIGIEVMDTRAACRTYNVLVSEDRNALAALMPLAPSD